MNKLTLIITFLSSIFNLKAQDYQHNFFERDYIMNHGIDIIRIENTCTSNAFITDGQSYCDLKTNTQEYFFNKFGLVDSFKIKNMHDILTFKEYNVFDENERLVQKTTYLGINSDDIASVEYAYNEQNKKIQVVNIRRIQDEIVLLDTIKYEWRGDTCLQFSIIDGEPMGTVLFMVYKEDGLETLKGEYDWCDQTVKYTISKNIYKNKRLEEEILYDITEGKTTHNYFYYDWDNKGRLKFKTKLLDSGADAISTNYVFNGDILVEMVETEKITGDLFKATYFYILNN